MAQQLLQQFFFQLLQPGQQAQSHSSSSQGETTYKVTINGKEIELTANGTAQDIPLDNGNGTLHITVQEDGSVSGSITPENGMAIKSVNIGNNDEPVDVDKRLNYPFDLNVTDLSNLGNVTIEFAERKTVKVTPPTEDKGTIAVTFSDGSGITQDTPIIEGDELFVTVKAGRSHEITSVTVGSKKYDATDKQKKSMTVPYTVLAGSGMAALFSSGSTEIPVSAEFKFAIVEGDPNTWPLDDQNNLVAPSSLTILPDDIGSYITGDITGIDLSACKNLATIDYQAFYYCDSLTSINLSGCTSLTTIGQSAFQRCKNLKTVTLPSAVTTIGHYAFNNCLGLTSINLSDCTSLQRIGDYAFYNCLGLTEINLSGCTNLTIGRAAFWGCSSLENITFYNVPEKIGPDAFFGVITDDRTLTIHCPSSNTNELKEKLKASGLTQAEIDKITFREDSTLTYPLGL